MRPITRRAATVAATLAGLMLGVQAAAQPAGSAAGPTVVQVQLYEFSFDPSRIELQAGRSYILRIINNGNAAHDLSAKAFFQAATLSPESSERLHDGKVELAKGASADLVVTPNTAGEYEMHCTHLGHSVLGMKGKIVVKPAG